MKRTKEIDIEKYYKIPEDIRIVRYNQKIIVIAVETASWIILDNENQLYFFELLRKHSLKEAILLFQGEKIDIQNTIIQIEAKGFENTTVTHFIDTSIHLYLTNKCNMKCPHCYMYAGKENLNELTTEEVFNILRLFKKYGGTSIILSGGEITMREDLYDIVKYGYSQGLKMELLTNGVLWTNELIEKIYPYITRIQISIDGFSEEKNAEIRGRGNFEKALETLDKFIKKGISTELAITPLYTNDLKNEIEAYANFGRQLKDKYKKCDFKVKYTTGLLDGREIHLSKEQKSDYTEIMNRVTSSYYGEDISDYAFINSHKKRFIFDNCSYGCLNISSTGDVYFCSRIPSIKPFANIRKDDFSRIVELSLLAQKLSNINNLKPCKDCELKYICGGGCRLKHFKDLVNCEDIEHLDINTISPRNCDRKTKEEFYDLMIRTNHKLFE